MARERESLVAILNSIDVPGDYLVERLFDGVGVGVSILANSGRVLQIFEHHRLREPLTGGGSSYRVSAPPGSELEAAVSSIVDHARLTGLSMFEFKKDISTGDWILLEVNARPWGSMALPVSLGVDFPYFLFVLLTKGKEFPRQTYRAGRFARHTTTDLTNLLDALRNEWRARPLKAIGCFAANVSSYSRVFALRETHDTFAWDDLAPAFADYRRFIGTAYSAVHRRTLLARLTRHWRRRGARATLRRTVANAGSDGAITIEFVCHGNICRSPFAKILLERLAHDRGLMIECRSSGTLPFADRKPPAASVAAACVFGVDLNSHRSSVIGGALSGGCTITVAFDRSNILALSKCFPELRSPVVLLSDFLDDADAPAEICDPYGGTTQHFVNVYSWIEKGIKNMVTQIAESSRHSKCR